MDISIPNLIIFSISFVVFCLVIVDFTRTRLRIKKLRAENVQLEFDKVVYMTKLTELALQGDNRSVEQTEGFLKFVSDSRDWAFEYIEDVQQAIQEFQAIADIVTINKDTTIALAEDYTKAYNKLMEFLPNEPDMVK